MKIYWLLLLMVLSSTCSFARHIAGGELYYTYTGPDPSNAANSVYTITLRLFRECNSSGPTLESEQATVGIYEGDILFRTLPLPRVSDVNTISLNTASFPCLVGNVGACYQVALYSATIVLPNSPIGYTLSRLGCCRVDFISNLSVPTSVGSNYVTKIPGRIALAGGTNSSPQFNVKDTALICSQKRFTLDFGAIDPDSDSLTYSFCDAFTSPGGGGGTNTQPPNTLSQIPLPYRAPYSGSEPLGSAVSIDPATGVISGIAPPPGNYVVNVCITEWRNGRPFAEHRKDFIMAVQGCDFIEANLPDKIIQCDNFTVLFENQSSSSAITNYVWNFGDSLNNTYPQSGSVQHTYKDTGVYKALLSVTGPKGCIGTDSVEVRVFPGFKSAFNIGGSCFLNPYIFSDLSSSVYGSVNFWKWNFGDESVLNDTSRLKNASYKYQTPSLKTVQLIVGDSKGCLDTLTRALSVSEKPLLQVPFKDTLICSIDSLPINVNSAGIFNWEPNINISNTNTANVLVYPKDTTKYIVSINNNGCISKDTITVNVLPFIKVTAGLDSTICLSDTIQLRVKSDALQYRWTNQLNETISSVKNPFVKPTGNTTYFITANLGKCQDKDSITITTVPYPIANLQNDTLICFGNRVQLNGSITGASFQWFPSLNMFNAGSLQPLVAPSKTTRYFLSVVDTLGCPKTVTDSILVQVAPKPIILAGNDTVISSNQPLQLNARGGEFYQWLPITGLSDPSIANPIAQLGSTIDSIIYRVRSDNGNSCYGEDFIKVLVYKGGPDIYIPSGFTPNGDGKNDLLRPIPIGIAQLTYFKLYNRWGQIIFSTNEIGKGWNGIFNGEQQPTGTYIFQAEGKDFTGKIIYKKGTAVLIR
jgi:gliding motility-associated-like protein